MKKQMIQLHKLRITIRNLLKEADVSGYATDTDVLLMHVLNIDKNTLLTDQNRLIDDDAVDKLMKMIDQRCKNTPVQYLIGKCEFMSLEFNVDNSTLIPRPDTEVLVEAVLAKESNAKGLEIGIGSGCISISLEHHGNNIIMQGVDISPKAVKMAKLNYKRLLSRDDMFTVSDIFENVPRGTFFDFIVSNPPYIETAEIAQLRSNVKDYEPRNALDGGADGLDFYRKIIAQAMGYLADGGRIYFEIGYNQARAVQEILAAAGYVDIFLKQDYAGKDRVVIARRN